MKRIVVLGACVALLASAVSADVRLPAVIGSKMVLQRDMDVPIWGWADPGEKVTVTIGEASVSATAGPDGKWSVKLPAMKAGGPVKVVVAGKNTIELTDVLIGEVWICSGQSNMAFALRASTGKDEAVAKADNPKVRLFTVARAASGTPQNDCQGEWSVSTAQTALSFSAVAYFFGLELARELDVPIGLIHTSWGGTRIEPWTPPVGFEGIESLKDIRAAIDKANADYAEASAAATQAVAHPLANRARPTGLYNGMIAPIVPYGIRGAIWYQGESNLGDGALYTDKMKALIAGWRKVWNEGDFPFYYVQIAPYNYGGSPDRLPKLWLAQQAAMEIRNTGMAVTMDVGNPKDIHPKDKGPVGKRLALWALAKTYDRKDLVYSGPVFKSLAVQDDKIVVTFDHVGGGLASRDGKDLTWFEIAGQDGKFVPAEAKIDGATVVVSAEGVAKPTAVRFAWDQVAEPNLMNKEGLPAATFECRAP